MENSLLLELLKKKGILSDKDIHEFDASDIYNAKDAKYNTEHMTESEAKETVSHMYHTEGGKKYIGERFCIYKAKEVCEKYRGIIPSEVSVFDIYVAINAQYHDYICLYKEWFSEDLEDKVIESAIHFWFMDEDYRHLNKVLAYFKDEK